MFTASHLISASLLVALTQVGLSGLDEDKKPPAPEPLTATKFQNGLRASSLGKVPPELQFKEQDWLGGPATKLESLKGHVIWLHFNF